MRLATLQTKSGAKFAFAFENLPQKYFLYEDWARQRSNDKMISPTTGLLDFVEKSEFLLPILRESEKDCSGLESLSPEKADFLLPFRPPSFRDFYCFEEHVKNGRRSRGLEIIPEWYEAPVFYYSNHLSFMGPNEKIPYPGGSTEVDFELEIACIVGKPLRNANLAAARAGILGFSVLNDFSLRDVWKFESKLGMGPAKSKDFATSLGSFIVTADEIEEKRTKKGYDFEFTISLNGEEITRRNWKEIQFSFEEMIVRASKSCTLYPGEILGSGTMGRGSLLEHNLDREAKRWLKKGDKVEISWLGGGAFTANTLGESIP